MLLDFALFPSGSAANGAVLWQQELDDTLRAAVESGRFRGPVTLAPPVATTFLKRAVLSAAEAARAREPGEAGKHIPFPLNEASWDCAGHSSEGNGGEWTWAAMRLEAAEGLCAVARRRGATVAGIVPAGAALALSLNYNYGAGGGDRLLVDVGAVDATLVAAAADGSGVVRILGRAAAPARARRIAAAGSGVAGDPTDGADDAGGLAERLVREIRRLRTAMRRPNEGAKWGAVFLSGERAMNPGLAMELADRLDQAVELFDPLRRVGVSPGAAGAAALGPQLGVVVGLALAATERPASGVNLLPPRLRRANELARRQRWWLAAAAVTVAALIPPLLGYSIRAHALRIRLSALERELVPLRVIDSRNQGRLREIAKLRQELKVGESLDRAKVGWVEWLAALQERFARIEGAWLDELELLPVGVEGSAAAPPALFGEGPRNVAAGAATSLRVRVSGRLAELGAGGQEARIDLPSRATLLMRELAQVPGVAGIGGERFDASQPGLLHFECVLEMNTEWLR